MSSKSYDKWENSRSKDLDELEEAHAAISGQGRGRRYATLQVNYALASLLSAHFQGFCRDLRTECADHLIQATRPQVMRNILRQEFSFARKLDRGTPNPGNLSSDFGRLGIDLWAEARELHAQSTQRKRKLQTLNLWRNAIAHQDFETPRLEGRMTLRLQEIRSWRSACHQLARTFDAVVAAHILYVTGTAPWTPKGTPR